MKFIKLLSYALLFSSTLFICSCTNDNKGAKDNANQKETAATTSAKSNTKVFPLVSNDKPQGKKAGDFVWKQDGKEVRFSEFTKDKYVLLNFWGTWCPPCRRELPDLISIAKEMEGKSLVVMGAAMERSQSMNEAMQVVSEFWESQQLYYPVVIGTQGLAEAYGGIQAYPTTFLINKNGEIVASLEGSRSKEVFMAEINKMMSDNNK